LPKIFNHPLYNGLISTIGPTTKKKLITTQKIQSPFFGCQIGCSKKFDHQIVLLKNIGHQIG
jgi:hypothetical protein